MTRSLHCLVTGKVQGVFFHSWVHDQAKSLNLCGWVRNIKDGEVEILAQGPDEALNELKSRLLQGSQFSQISNLETNIVDYDKCYPDFQIRG